jgi:hypothetical protein
MCNLIPFPKREQRAFDKKRRREGKEEEKKRLTKKISPHIFLISSHLHLVLLWEKKRIFE